jgi:hypothetical protein
MTRGHGEPRQKGFGEKVAYKLGELALEQIVAKKVIQKLDRR